MGSLQLEYGRGDLLADKYTVADRLDDGPLGVTYSVRQSQSGYAARALLLDPSVAGKDQKQQIIDAVKLGRRVAHRNLLKINELSQHAGVAMVVYEDLADSKTLRELMDEAKAQNTPFSLKDAAQITIQILEGARALHDAGHTFRSLRPEYVLVSQRRTGPRGQTVVYDVRLWGAGIWNLVPPGIMAEDEFSRGEASYLAPELKGAQPSTTPRADIYSAGVMFYEMLCGQPPVGTYQLPRQRRPELPVHLDSVIELALANASEDRYPTAADFIADIQRSFQSGPEEDLQSPRGSWLVWVLGALLVVAIMVLLFERSRTDPHENALKADNQMRKDLHDSYPKLSEAQLREVESRKPQNMVHVPAGPFVTGRLSHEADDAVGATASTKELPGFLIDAFEYPNLAKADPKRGVTYTEAEALCTEQGKRLCSADELEKACRGPENFVYGYADDFRVDVCGEGLEGVHKSGALADCKSNWGVYDIAGNLREWTSTPKSDGRRLVKGGMAKAPGKGTRCAYSTDLSEGFTDETVSFRCCQDIPAGDATAAPAPAAAPAP